MKAYAYLLAAWMYFCIGKRVRRNRFRPFILLVRQYRQKHRAYHGTGHIVFGLCELWRCRHLAEDFWAVLFAWLFHDYFYDIGMDLKNEQRSAEAAYEAAMEMGLGVLFARAVYSLILTTVYDPHQKLPLTIDHQLISDIDLAIFGQSELDFDRYERRVRREYRNVPLATFCMVRADILNRFLERRVDHEPRIYLTWYYHHAYGDVARQNLLRATDRLRNRQWWYQVA